ncbi:MAG: hypothetical protein ACR9NN_18365 [Nostochopsis sp.]
MVVASSVAAFLQNELKLDLEGDRLQKNHAVIYFEHEARQH